MPRYCFTRGGGVQYLFLILFSVCVNYFLGIDLNRREGKRRKIALVIGVVFNILFLGIFKYFNFTIANIKTVFGLADIVVLENAPYVPLPIGISFFTFQILSYIIDLYYKKIKVQKSIFDLALYIMMFPQLIAGPIVRYETIEQEVSCRKIDTLSVRYGLIRFVQGLGKKLIIANAMSEIVEWSYSFIEVKNFAIAWIGAIAYTFQIYYDFSAYSDMAIGMGRMMGFHFWENFDYPYISKSIKEFWRRWHISLSSWFRDYVYIPLGGNRKGIKRTYINLIIVFLLTGFWHGASWNFVFWGVYHGFFLIIERTRVGNFLEKLPVIFRHLYTILVVVVGWVFFRASTMIEAWNYLKNMFSFCLEQNQNVGLFLDNRMIIMLIIALFMSIFPKFNKKIMFWLQTKNRAVNFVQDIGLFAFYLVCICFLVGSGFNPFIYFKF